MMKLRPKMLESGKGSLGGLGTWIPVVVVVVCVLLHLFGVLDELWAALAVAAALLYTMAEPVVFRIVRPEQFPGWARFATLGLLLVTLGWLGLAGWSWATPGVVVAEGELATTEDALKLSPSAPGEPTDFRLEVRVAELPALEKEMTFPWTLRVGTADVRGHFGRELVRNRLTGEELRARPQEYHRLHVALDPKKDKLRLGSLVRAPGGTKLSEEERKESELAGPVHVRLEEVPFTRLQLGLITGALALLAALLEAFEDRQRKERSRVTMLVGGMAAAVIYLLMAVNPGNLLMGVLGSAIVGLGGALGAFVLAWLAQHLIPARRGS
ncbi:MAG: hypothetical protein JXB32_03600 [Deltaproteobacteria bacterium]|nr:hypothetical protein [Deltaproteobacteria bacterium]